MDALIDPQTTPFSSKAEIAAEIEEIRKLPQSAARDEMIETMQGWIERSQRED